MGDEAECHDPPTLIVVGGVSSDRVRTPMSTVDTVGGAGLYASLGAALAGMTHPVGLAGLLSDDLDAETGDLLKPRVVPRLTQVPGGRLHFDITYDAAWRAEYAVDGAEAEDRVTYELVPECFRSARAFHLCPTGSPSAQLALAEAIRSDPRAACARLSATTFRNRIVTEPHTVRSLWKLIDVLVCNAEEATLLTGRPDLDAALDHLSDELGGWSRHGMVCVTDGDRGAHLVTAASVLPVAAYPVRVIDPTGAGETFAGAFAAGYAAVTDARHAATVACAVASFAVEDFGPARLLTARPDQVRERAAAITREGGT